MIKTATDYIRRSGRLEVFVLAGLLLVVAGVWTFGAMAAKVMEGNTQRFDDHVLLALRKPGDPAVPIGPRWTLQVARDLTAFGSPTGLFLVTAVVCGFLLLERRPGVATFVLGSVLGGSSLSLVLKEWFRRPRPEVVPHLAEISMSSFPSGHSMLSSVTYLTLAALLARVEPQLRLKVYFLAVAAGLSGIVGCSRVYLGVHYPTDVLAGWCVGATWALFCCILAHVLSSRHWLRVSE